MTAVTHTRRFPFTPGADALAAGRRHHTPIQEYEVLQVADGVEAATSRWRRGSSRGHFPRAKQSRLKEVDHKAG
jgi:hypothetical protein